MPGTRETVDNLIRAWWVANVVPELSGTEVVYTGWPESPPASFVVFDVDWTTTTQITLGIVGARDFRFRGFVDIQCASSIGDGPTPSLALVDTIEAQILASAPAGVVFQESTTTRAFREGAHWIRSIRVPFYSDQRA